MSQTEMADIAPEDRIDLKSKLGYSFTSLGSQLVQAIFVSSLIIYYREQLLLSEIYIIWAFLFYAIWNATNDPLFGWLSDKTRTRWGRRLPYLWLFTPIMTISFVLIWTGPTTEEVGQFGVFLYMLLTMAIYDTAYTATLLVWSALGQELSMDHRERGNLQVFSMIFGVFGTLVALVLPMLFLEGGGREGFIFLAIIMAIVQFVTMGITSITVKEKLEFSQVDKPLGLIDSLKYTLKSKSFIILVSMNFCLIFIQFVFFGNLFFYAYYAFPGYDSFSILIMIIIFILAGIVVGLLYTVKVNDKKGVKTALIRALFFHGIGFLLVGLLPGLFALIGFFFVGMGFYGAMTLFNAAFGEVADEDEVKTGTRREAAIFGINALITKPAQSIAGTFIALILILFLYQAPIGGVQQLQSDFTILGIRIAMGIVPGLVCFLAILILKKSPLHGEYLKEIKTKMAIMHKEKKQKLLLKTSEKPKN